MNDDRLRYAELVELLTEGPVGVRRDWAATLVLRMLETRGGCHYRPDDQARWRSPGSLDWLAGHPEDPRAGDALAAAKEAARSDVRKAAADLAQALGHWDVVEALAQSDPDRGSASGPGSRVLPIHSGAPRGSTASCSSWASPSRNAPSPSTWSLAAVVRRR